jgi:hypothetical protein
MNAARFSLAGFAGMVLLGALVQGCVGVTGPPALSRSEQATVEAARLDIRLGVQGKRRVKRVETGRAQTGQVEYGDEDVWLRDKFIAAVRERKLFRDVDRLEAFYPNVDLVATVNRWVVADNPLPVWTLITLGLFPTVANDREGLEVTFAAPDSRTTVKVATEHDGTTVLGWAGGLFAAIAPGWMFPGTYDRRMYDRLELDIARKADAILSLASRRHPR